jgi:hypothetical protein
MKKIVLPLFLLLFTFTISCDNNLESLKKNSSAQADEQAVKTAINFFDFSITEFQRVKPVTAKQKENLLWQSIRTFEQTHGVSFSAKSQKASNTVQAEEVNPKLAKAAEQLVYLTSIAADENDYLSKVEKLEADVHNYSVEDSVKSQILTHILLQKELVGLLKEKVTEADVLYWEGVANGTINAKETNPPKKGWWLTWGKCATAITSGSIGGAWTFGTGAAAGCTFAIPIIGTVGCGAVGTVVGGIVGGLGRAVAGCDEVFG